MLFLHHPARRSMETKEYIYINGNVGGNMVYVFITKVGSIFLPILTKAQFVILKDFIRHRLHLQNRFF